MKQYFSSLLKCPERNRTVAVGLLCIATLWCLMLIANPGFFNHDELQKIDHIRRFGFSDYLRNHVKLYQGTEFGQPVRPFSFLVQGLVSYFIPSYPFIVHFVDVLTHAVIAMLLFGALTDTYRNRQFAWIAAIVFVCSPLATFSVGWSAALMDRFYVLFGLLAFIASARYVSLRSGPIALAGVFLASTLAMFSKETAAVLPGSLLLFLFFPPAAGMDFKRLIKAFVVWSLPVLMFLAYRATALIGSFAAKESSPYAASLSHLLDGVLVYGIYPFLPSLTEAGIWQFQPVWEMVAAAVAHFLVVGLLWRSFSIRVAILYVVCYYSFLAPVLLIPTRGAHYLYGSGIAQSVALAAIFVLSPQRKKMWGNLLVICLFAGASIHAFVSQNFIYSLGSCMNSASVSLESAYLSGGRPERMQISVDEGAPGHILHRLTTGREQIGNYYPVHFEILDRAQGGAAAAPYGFNESCIVFKR
ncbi:hypothetical protein [Variovorax boronicumulans]|uniref:hypothetical protein n=1 Tax=Variovorax boronicumulans TaxID=436515 RepID=UPI001C58F1F6